MIVRPRPGREAIVAFADAVNPFIVVLSIVGLFLEYTPAKFWVAPVDKVLDLVFVADFLLRLACHKPLKYLAKGYGWVDLLASLPGLMLLFSWAQVFALFKFVRIGRFFKIIRVLRFLRVFNFLKRMKSDSPWIQDRVMQIGVVIVLCNVAGIFLADMSIRSALEETRAESLQARWREAGHDLARLAAEAPGFAGARLGGKLLDLRGEALPGGQAAWDAALSAELHWSIEVRADDGSGDAILASADDLMARHDRIMLILLGTLVALLFVVVFYLGAVFAADMSIVQLIIDSVEAEDLLLLEQEALRQGGGRLELESDESEMKSLLKVVARLGGMSGLAGAPGTAATKGLGEDSGLPDLDLAGIGLPGAMLAAPAEGLGPASASLAPDELVAQRLEAVDERLTRIERALSASNKSLVVETTRIIAPAIVRAVKKALKDRDE